MRVLILLLLVLAAACGRTPTAPPPCTALTAWRTDTTWIIRRDGTRAWIAILYQCRS